MNKHPGLRLRVKLLVVRMMMNLLPPCRDVAHLTSMAMDEELSMVALMKVRMHIWMCEFCRRNEQQLKSMRELIRRQTTADSLHRSEAEWSLPEESRQRMKDNLRSQG